MIKSKLYTHIHFSFFNITKTNLFIYNSNLRERDKNNKQKSNKYDVSAFEKSKNH